MGPLTHVLLSVGNAERHDGGPDLPELPVLSHRSGEPIPAMDCRTDGVRHVVTCRQTPMTGPEGDQSRIINEARGKFQAGVASCHAAAAADAARAGPENAPPALPSVMPHPCQPALFKFVQLPLCSHPERCFPVLYPAVRPDKRQTQL